MAQTELHTPVPDGRSGPFCREPHSRRELDGVSVLSFDPRCEVCLEYKASLVQQQADYETEMLRDPATREATLQALSKRERW